MSTLGKIVTIFIVIASVAVGMLVVADAKLGEDWRQVALKADEGRRVAVETVKVLKAALVSANYTYDKTRQAYLTKLGEDQKTIGNLRDQITGLDREKQQQETRLEELKADVKRLANEFNRVNEEKTRLQSEHDQAVTLSVQLRDANQDLVKKNQNLRREVDDLRERVRQFQLDTADLTKQLNWYVVHWPGGEVPKEVPVVPTVDLIGVVSEADNERKVAQISLGSSDKVVEGMVFVVSRNDRYLADLVVTKVDENSSVGRLQTVQDEIREGDNVSYTVRR